MLSHTEAAKLVHILGTPLQKQGLSVGGPWEEDGGAPAFGPRTQCNSCSPLPWGASRPLVSAGKPQA